MVVTGAYFTELFARTKRLDSLKSTLAKLFPDDDGKAARTLEEKADAARRFLGIKKKKAS